MVSCGNLKGFFSVHDVTPDAELPYKEFKCVSIKRYVNLYHEIVFHML